MATGSSVCRDGGLVVGVAWPIRVKWRFSHGGFLCLLYSGLFFRLGVLLTLAGFVVGFMRLTDLSLAFVLLAFAAVYLGWSVWTANKSSGYEHPRECFADILGDIFTYSLLLAGLLCLAARAEASAAGANAAAESLLDSHRVFRGDDWCHVY